MNRIRLVLLLLTLFSPFVQTGIWAESPYLEGGGQQLSGTGLVSEHLQNNNSKLIPVALRVYFKQNVIYLEPTYRDNEQRLNTFVNTIQTATADSTYQIQEIVIRSGASPEGPFDHNLYLSQNRGEALRDYLKYALDIPDSLFTLQPVGEDWEGFRRLVLQYRVPNSEKVVAIIDDYLAAPEKTAQLSALSKLAIGNIDNGKTSDYIYRHIYPELRSANNQVMCYLKPVERRVVETVEYRTAAGSGAKDTVYLVGLGAGAGAGLGAAYGVATGDELKALKDAQKNARKEKRQNRGYRFALKTNLLFDLAACVNAEVEFPIGKRVSIMGEHTFPWYTYNDNRYAMQIQMSSLELRIWLGDRKKKSYLTGWFLGGYGSYGYGDVEWDSKGYQCKSLWHAGLSAGYSAPLGKRDNWRLETSIAVGYAPISYDYYERSDYYKLLMYKNSGNYTWIGPTKLKCSLVWMLPMNKKEKGGKK